MSCGCESATGPMCGPPQPVATIVAGPPGATGPSGPTGPAGFGVTGPTGATGSVGQPGPIGQNGALGATGATGASGAPIAFFTGEIWAPSLPTDDLENLQGSRVLDFGAVNFNSGAYLFMLAMQIGWNGGEVGANELNGSAVFLDGIIPRQTIAWGRSKKDPAGQSLGYAYAEAQGYAHIFQATITSGNHLYLTCSDQFYILGAQLTVFALPANVINSPGFI